eukprot:4398729-Pleurochrysis_carterae.AAC.1
MQRELKSSSLSGVLSWRKMQVSQACEHRGSRACTQTEGRPSRQTRGSDRQRELRSPSLSGVLS